MTPTIGFIGLGMMGMPMATRLAAAGHRLLVADTAAAAVQRFLQANPTAAQAARLEEFAGASVVITMLPSSDAVDSVVRGSAASPGLVSILQPDSVLVDMSSSEPGRTRQLASELAAHRIHMLDAPVSGGVKRAVDGSLAIMVGGPAEIASRCQPLFEAMGKTIRQVGGPGAGHAVKALNNYVSAAGLVAAAEALLVGRAFGLDPAVMTDVFNSSTGRNNSTENKLKQFILSGRFDAGFSLRLMDKDLATAFKLAQDVGQPMQLGTHLVSLWHEAAGALPPQADHTEIFRYLEGDPAHQG
jgi:3-hydroxyisobutyrate dehydrogenase